MTNRFVISDTHFGHENSWAKFKLNDGCTPLRPYTSTEEMNEDMIAKWNAKVGPKDVVYHLGDVVINKKYLPILDRLNGSKRLIMGNHDIFGVKEYLKYFTELYGCRVFVDKFILSHIPHHPDSITERFVANVHGHYHANFVKRPSNKAVRIIDPETLDQKIVSADDYRIEMTEDDLYEPDPRYLCVCVEQTNFEPLSFEEVEERIQDRWTQTGYVKPAKGWGNGSGPG